MCAQAESTLSPLMRKQRFCCSIRLESLPHELLTIVASEVIHGQGYSLFKALRLTSKAFEKVVNNLQMISFVPARSPDKFSFGQRLRQLKRKTKWRLNAGRPHAAFRRFTDFEGVWAASFRGMKRLTNIPFARNISHLYISGTSVTDISMLKSIRTLNVSNTLVSDVSTLPNQTHTLIADFCPLLVSLTSLPDELEYLSLKGFALTLREPPRFPGRFKLLDSLNILDLSRCKLASFTADLKCSELHLVGTSLSEEQSLRYVKNVTRLNLAYMSLGRNSAFESLSGGKVKFLSVQGTNVAGLLCELPELIALNVSFTRLCNVLSFPKLERLIARRCRLMISLAGLLDLVYLDASSSSVAFLPYALRKMEHLDVAQCMGLTSIPEAPCLRYLDVSKTRVSDLSNINAPLLRTINVSGSLVTTCSGFENVTEANLSSTRISSVAPLVQAQEVNVFAMPLLKDLSPICKARIELTKSRESSAPSWTTLTEYKAEPRLCSQETEYAFCF